MKKIYLLIAACFYLLTGFSQDLSTQWYNRAGGAGDEYGAAVVTDLQNNVYSTGYFSQTVDFDPSAGVQSLTSNGTFDLYVQKHDPNGNLLWVKGIGGTGDDGGKSICVDASGNIYVTGFFTGSVDFDPNSGVFTLASNGARDGFVLKLDSSGNMVWAKAIGGTGNDEITSIMMDAFGDLVYGGNFHNTIDLDPNTGVTNVTSIGLQDMFITKMNTFGNFYDGFSQGGTDNDNLRDVAGDGSGNIFVTGYFRGTVDFNPGPGSFTYASYQANGNYLDDIFIQKLTPIGNFVWAQRIGGVGSDYAEAIEIDAFGSVLVTGQFAYNQANPVDFDPGAGVFGLTSVSRDGYIVKLDNDGAFDWAIQIGGANNNDYGFDLSTDLSGNVYAIGKFAGGVDFDPGSGVTIVASSSNQNYDLYILKLDINGAFVLAKSIPDTGLDITTELPAIKVDQLDNIYVSGSFQNNVDFDVSSGASSVTANGATDSYLIKLGDCAPSNTTDVVTACSQYTWINGTTYTASNSTATYVLQNQAGCDSIVTLDLTINLPSNSNDVINSCGPYTWIDGNTYNTSNSAATFILPAASANGCDSIIHLDLTVSQPVNPSVLIVASSDSICQGTAVTFTASPTNGGASPSYQWFLNGSQVGTSSTYNTTTLSNNDEVYVILTSSGTCLTQSTATSDTITMVVGNPGAFPTINISSSVSNNSICEGDQVTFTSSITNGGNYPSYYWEVNGQAAGTNSSQLIVSNLVDGDQVFCSLISSDGCLLTTQAGSNITTMTVYPIATPNVTISGPSQICIGDNAMYSSTSIDEGSSPIHNWYINSSTTSIGSGVNLTTNALNDGDTLFCVLVNNDPCTTVNYDISNTIIVQVQSNVTPTISISSDVNPACAGELITFTSTVSGEGSFPGYQWLLNGNNIAGEVSASYSSSTLSDLDAISCVLVSSLSCATSSTVNSNQITLMVNPMPLLSVTQAGLELTSNEVNGTYQWIDCENGNTPISNATNQSYNVTVNGEYAVVVSNGNCSDTSTCVTINSVGVNELNNENVQIYPNPTTGNVKITSDNQIDQLKLYNIEGKELISIKNINKSETTIELPEQVGVYFISIFDVYGSKSTTRIIKN